MPPSKSCFTSIIKKLPHAQVSSRGNPYFTIGPAAEYRGLTSTATWDIE
ncbi:MAG: hypothetical protein JRJ48_04610 [Deltaproteobacteria bacterium]|nr:hypothetical protein [Deltaproteobacteria bacterium]